MVEPDSFTRREGGATCTRYKLMLRMALQKKFSFYNVKPHIPQVFRSGSLGFLCKTPVMTKFVLWGMPLVECRTKQKSSALMLTEHAVSIHTVGYSSDIQTDPCCLLIWEGTSNPQFFTPQCDSIPGLTWLNSWMCQHLYKIYRHLSILLLLLCVNHFHHQLSASWYICFILQLRLTSPSFPCS